MLVIFWNNYNDARNSECKKKVSSLLPVTVFLHLWIRTAPSGEHSQLDTCSQENYLLTITHTVATQNTNLCSRINLCTHTHTHTHTHIYTYIYKCILAVSLLWLITHKAGRNKYRCFLSGRFFRNLLVAKSICLQMMRPLVNNRIYKKWPWPTPDTTPKLACRYCLRLPAD